MFNKLKIQLSPNILLVGGLVILTLVTTLGGLWHYQYELGHSTQLSTTGSAATHAKTNTGATSAAGSSVADAIQQQVSNTKTSKTSASSNSSSTSDSSTAATQAQSQTSANPIPTVQKVSLSLSVNGAAKGTVTLPSGDTQCQVLSEALADGLISDLNMRYSSEYGTNAVYVINGQGDPDVINWTYTVNRKLPPYGCSKVTAHDGDVVNWQYIKS